MQDAPAQDSQQSAPTPRPVLPTPNTPWVSQTGDFIVAQHACGCPVKVRDEAAAARMAAVACKKHAT